MLRVVDGDTVHVAKDGDTTVRVIGIDTPETVDPSTPDECFGAAASAQAAELLTGRQVYLTPDPSQDSTDRYGRALAYLGLPEGDYGLQMISGGFAEEYTYDTAYARQAQYRAAQAQARTARQGLWPACGGADTPAQPGSTPATTAPPAADSGVGASYPSCAAARSAGAAPLRRGQPGYRDALDGDSDGVACE